MTGQTPDTIIFDNRTFIIIDVEHGKHPHAEFVSIPADYIRTTDNRRGFKAEYRIENGKLFGRQNLDICSPDRYNDEDDSRRHTHSPETPLHYTGSLLIGRKNDEHGCWNTDFIESYTDADEAFELCFENGSLTETRNLAEAATEKDDIRKSLWYTSELITPEERSAVLSEHWRTYLKHPYGCSTYRWTTGTEEENPDSISERRFRELEEKMRKRSEDCAEVERILSYLPLFREKKGNYLKWIPAENEGEPKTYEIPDKEAYDKFEEFKNSFYHSPLYDYLYPDHIETLFAYYPNRDEAMLHADRTEICAILTGVIRSYHFCVNNEGYEEDIEDGTYIPILENLERIVDETYHPWKKTDLRTGDARFAGMKNWNKDETLPPDEPEDLEETTVRPQMGKVLRIIDKTYIAGSSYVNLDDEEYEKRFYDNKPLNLVLEPENQYDKKAVRVEDSKHVKLGYLPRDVNDIPYRLLRGGYHVYAYPLWMQIDTKRRYYICVIMDIAEK